MLLGAIALVAVIVAGVAAAGGAFATRVSWTALERPGAALAPEFADASDTVYLFAGADSGIDRPRSDSQYTEDPDAPARADILLLVRLAANGDIVALSLPRDTVAIGYDTPVRYAITRLDGPQHLVDAICAGTGIAVDRYVEIDGGGFEAAIDALGGLHLDIPEPLRDPAARLEIDEAGPRTVDGATALALVRSRHAERFVDGRWIPRTEDEGALDRMQWSSAVLGAVREKLAGADPLTLARAAWASSDALTIGGGIHPEELRRLAGSSFDAQTIPTEMLGDNLSRALREEGRAVIGAAGFDTSCQLEGAAGVR